MIWLLNFCYTQWSFSINKTLIDESINPPSTFQTLMTIITVIRVLLFWASWLRLVGELQQKKVFPRLTEAAVADSQQNLHLIKNVAPLSLADTRAGLASFELVRRALTVTWEVELELGYYHTNWRTYLHCDHPAGTRWARHAAPPKDNHLSQQLNCCDLWSEHARLYRPGCSIYVACLEVTRVSHGLS